MLEVEDLVVTDDFKVPRVKHVSFSVRAGEIVGIAGVAGNGQSELLESISGMRDQQSGVIRLNGTPLSLEGDDGASRARAAGLAHVPEDRLRMGLITNFSEWENSILGYEDRYGKGLGLDIGAAREAAEAYIKKFDIRPPNKDLKTANFSGGNQQKIVLAREMERDPDVLIVGQPTRGVDIGAIEFIHNQIIKMRDAGKAILLVSVELDEIRSLSDRILVLFDGQIVGEADPATADETELGLLMTGSHPSGDLPAKTLPPHETPVQQTLVEMSPQEQHRQGHQLMRALPRWVDVAAAAAAQCGAGLSGRRPDRAGGWPEPAAGRWNHALRRLRLWLGLRLHALLHHRFHLRRSGGVAGLSCRPVQHRGRGAGLSRRSRRHPDRPRAQWRQLDRGVPADDRLRRAVRRGLGLRAGLSASQARQPRRHHHDPVQLHRRVADELHHHAHPEAGRSELG